MSNEKYKLTEQDVDSFDELFSKELTRDEFVIIQTRLEADELFRYKFQIYKRLRKEIETEGESSEVLKYRFQRLELQQKSKRKLKWISLPIAASIIFVVVFVLMYNNKQKDAYEKAYADYQYSDPGLPITMAADQVSYLDSAMIAFNKQDYQNAYTALNKIKLTDTVQYYKAICLELSNEDQKAMVIYETTQNSSSSFIASKSKFRLLLMYVKHKDDRYKKLLDEIAADELNPYQSSAVKIRSRLGED